MPTTKQSGLGDNFYVGGYDLSGDVASVDTISGARDVIDTTAIKQLANSRLYGLKNGNWSFTSFFDVTGTTNAPGVPASGTPVVSTLNWSVFVTVTGGTGTQVSINGVNQGSFDGTYILPAFGTIILTYTAAPTWTWKAVGTEHSALSPLPTTDQVAMYFRGTGIGGIAAAINAKEIAYDGTRDNSGNLTFKVELTGNSFGMEWGEQLTPGISVLTTAGNLAFQDDGAGTTFGGQAYLQIFNLVGTNADVAIQSSTTSGGTYTNVTGLDFGSIAAASVPYAARVASTNVTSISEFVRVNVTGTFSYLQFAVAFMRNPIAGVVF
jgi:hypothetical protein